MNIKLKNGVSVSMLDLSIDFPKPTDKHEEKGKTFVEDLKTATGYDGTYFSSYRNGLTMLADPKATDLTPVIEFLSTYDFSDE